MDARVQLVLCTLAHRPGSSYTIEPFLPYLDEDEQVRAGRFLREADTWSYAAAHALLRAVLTRLHGRPPLAWRFATGPYGKPELIGTASPILINLSHTRDLVACLVSRGRVPPGLQLGVDVESTERATDLEGLAKRYFHESERAALRALRPDQRGPAFFRLWSLKEAAVKALGLGLSLSFDRFACTLDTCEIAGPSDLLGAPESWQLRTWLAGDRHVLATAVRASHRCRVRIRQVRLTAAPA